MSSNTKRTILEAKDIAPLTEGQRQHLEAISRAYAKREQLSTAISTPELLSGFRELDQKVDELVLRAVHHLSFPRSPSISENIDNVCLIGTLRDKRTDTYRFREAVDEAYRLLFRDSFCPEWTYGLIDTPVNIPAQQRAGTHIPHEFPGEDFCMGVILRAGLRSAIVLGDKIEQATGKTPTYALFRISRSHDEKESIRYFLDEGMSHYRGEDIHGRHLVAPDLMLALGGSLIGLDRLLTQEGITPAEISVHPLFAAVEGVFNLANNTRMRVRPLRIDPILNRRAYILPGCGDAGDRLIGEDCPADLNSIFERFGAEFCRRYRSQVERIYETTKQALPEVLFK